eukprot:gene12969-8825_t
MIYNYKKTKYNVHFFIKKQKILTIILPIICILITISIITIGIITSNYTMQLLFIRRPFDNFARKTLQPDPKTYTTTAKQLELFGVMELMFGDVGHFFFHPARCINGYCSCWLLLFVVIIIIIIICDCLVVKIVFRMRLVFSNGAISGSQVTIFLEDGENNSIYI